MDLDVDVVVVVGKGVKGISFFLSTLDSLFTNERKAVEENETSGDQASNQKSESQIERDDVQSGGLKMTSQVSSYVLE
jgi:hypothetical protein